MACHFRMLSELLQRIESLLSNPGDVIVVMAGTYCRHPFVEKKTDIAPALEQHHGTCDWDHGMFVWGRNGSGEWRLAGWHPACSLTRVTGKVREYTLVSTFHSHDRVGWGTAVMMQAPDDSVCNPQSAT